MMLGAIAFFVYASVVSRILMRYPVKALWVTLGVMPMWFAVALGAWAMGLGW